MMQAKVICGKTIGLLVDLNPGIMYISSKIITLNQLEETPLATAIGGVSRREVKVSERKKINLSNSFLHFVIYVALQNSHNSDSSFRLSLGGEMASRHNPAPAGRVLTQTNWQLKLSGEDLRVS
jgi:hypothetical protein